MEIKRMKNPIGTALAYGVLVSVAIADSLAMDAGIGDQDARGGGFATRGTGREIDYRSPPPAGERVVWRNPYAAYPGARDFEDDSRVTDYGRGKRVDDGRAPLATGRGVARSTGRFGARRFPLVTRRRHIPGYRGDPFAAISRRMAQRARRAPRRYPFTIDGRYVPSRGYSRDYSDDDSSSNESYPNYDRYNARSYPRLSGYYPSSRSYYPRSYPNYPSSYPGSSRPSAGYQSSYDPISGRISALNPDTGHYVSFNHKEASTYRSHVDPTTGKEKSKWVDHKTGRRIKSKTDPVTGQRRDEYYNPASGHRKVSIYDSVTGKSSVIEDNIQEVVGRATSTASAAASVASPASAPASASAAPGRVPKHPRPTDFDVTHSDGTVSRRTVLPDGSISEYYTNADGSIQTRQTHADGSVTDTTTRADGSSNTYLDHADGTSTGIYTDSTGRTNLVSFPKRPAAGASSGAAAGA